MTTPLEFDTIEARARSLADDADTTVRGMARDMAALVAEVRRLRALCHEAVDSWSDAASHYPALRIHPEHQDAAIVAFLARIAGTS